MTTTKEIRKPVYCKIEPSSRLTDVATKILDRDVLSAKGRSSGVRTITYKNGSGWIAKGDIITATIGGVSAGTVMGNPDRDFGAMLVAIPDSIVLARDDDGWYVSDCGDADADEVALAFESSLVRSAFELFARAIRSSLADGMSPNPQFIESAKELARHYSAQIGWGVNRLAE